MLQNAFKSWVGKVAHFSGDQQGIRKRNDRFGKEKEVGNAGWTVCMKEGDGCNLPRRYLTDWQLSGQLSAIRGRRPLIFG